MAVAGGLGLASAQALAQAETVAVLRGLDKITARVSVIEVPVGGTAEFGRLTIAARGCAKRPPEEPPEVVAFLEIVEQPPGGTDRAMRFSGWMFASSPALSALDHAVYDVSVIDCRTASTETARPKQ